MSGPHRAVLALGSNLGDRLAMLQSVVDACAAHDGVVVDEVSSVFETAPVGGPEQGAYLNAVLLVTTALSPEALLAFCHEVEAAADRERTVRWGPRTLDIDVIAYDDLVRAEPDPVLPHPRAWERAFVLLPWLDADPEALLPGVGPIAVLAEAADDTGVRRTDWTLVVGGAGGSADALR